MAPGGRMPAEWLADQEEVRPADAKLALARPDSVAALMFPRPGNARFDDDAQFASLPVFMGYDGTIVRAGDPEWILPASLLPNVETLKESSRRLKFHFADDIAGLISDDSRLRRLRLAWQRSVYLMVHHHSKPLSASALRQRSQTVRRLVEQAVRNDHLLHEFDYDRLKAFRDAIPTSFRKLLPGVFATLAGWHRVSPSCPFFDPSVLRIEADAIAQPALLRRDIEGIGTEMPHVPKPHRPLPDAFVAALGEAMMNILDNVQPIVIECVRRLRQLENAASPDALHIASQEVIRSMDWSPLGDRRPATMHDLRSLAVDCQTCAQAAVSLAFGPRIYELLSMKGACIGVNGDGWAAVRGWMTKQSQLSGGEPRDWPAHPVLVEIIERQAAYVQVCEGDGFEWLWKSHTRLLGAGHPCRSIWQQLNKLVRNLGLFRLLDCSTITHHRFRKTVVRQIALALDGAPSVIRRILGQQDLAVAFAYIMSDDTIIDDLREISDDLRLERLAKIIDQADELQGGGASGLAAAKRKFEKPDVFVPEGRQSQRDTKAVSVAIHLSENADGLNAHQIYPGIVCVRPLGEAGRCCTKSGETNVARCKSGCIWHVLLPEYEHQARENVLSSLRHIEADPDNPLIRSFYGPIVVYWAGRFPLVGKEFSGNATYRLLTA